MHRAYMHCTYMPSAAKTRKGGRAAGPPLPDSEEAFLATYDLTAFPRPSVAVDVVVLTTALGALRAVVYQRREHPGRGKHALPGGFVGIDESLDHAAARLLRDKAG